MEDETRNIQDNPDIRLAFRGKLAKSRRLFRRIQSVNPFAYRGGATWLLLGKWGIKMEKKMSLSGQNWDSDITPRYCWEKYRQETMVFPHKKCFLCMKIHQKSWRTSAIFWRLNGSATKKQRDLSIGLVKLHEPPSKSILYAWYKNISYRFWGGPIALRCFVQINTK